MIKEYVPLTIKIELDSKYLSMNFTVYQNNTELPFRIDNKYLFIEVNNLLTKAKRTDLTKLTFNNFTN